VNRAAALAACGLLTACATAAGPLPSPPVRGYLDAATVDAMADGFGAPPPSPTLWPGDLDAGATGSDRWWLATSHAEIRPPEAAQHFDCALSTRLAARPRPALTRLMNRLLTDSIAVSARLRERYARPRPVSVEPTLQPCQRIDAATRDSPSWPSAAAVAGAAYGEMFAELAPDRAEAARFIGRELGHSRVVCRMNWTGDVEAGQRAGRRVYAAAREAPDFQADLEAARSEVVAARAEGLSSPSCAAERRALGPMPGGAR
jgi:acid phosphatase (class A)